jgi:NADH-quinone oxidoreductase subunit M
LNGFVGEILVLLGMFQRAFAETPDSLLPGFHYIAILAVSGVVLGAWYMLYLIQRVFFGPLKEPHEEGEHHEVHDMNLREILAVAPLCVFMVWIGLQPDILRQRMEPTLNQITAATAAPFQARYNTQSTAASSDAPEGEQLTRVR